MNHRAAQADLLHHALEDDHVGVHRHADAQDDTCNTGQRELDAGNDGDEEEQEDNVHAQRPVSHQAAHAVAHEHDEHDDQNADDGRRNAGGKRVDAQRGGDGIQLVLAQIQRQRAALQLEADVLRLFLSEAAGHHHIAAVDGLVDGGAHEHDAVQLDGDGLANGLGGHVAEDLRALAGQAEADGGHAGLGIGDGGSGLQVTAFHEHIAVRIKELQLRRRTDQVQHGRGVGYIRDLHADAGLAQLAHCGFRIALFGEAVGDDAHGGVQQRAEVIALLAHFIAHRRFIFHIHAALEVQAQSDGLRPVVHIGGGQPGQQLVQPPAIQPCAVEAQIAHGQRKHQRHAQHDDRGGPLAHLHAAAIVDLHGMSTILPFSNLGISAETRGSAGFIRPPAPPGTPDRRSAHTAVRSGHGRWRRADPPAGV